MSGPGPPVANGTQRANHCGLDPDALDYCFGYMAEISYVEVLENTYVYFCYGYMAENLAFEFLTVSSSNLACGHACNQQCGSPCEALGHTQHADVPLFICGPFRDSTGDLGNCNQPFALSTKDATGSTAVAKNRQMLYRGAQT